MNLFYQPRLSQGFKELDPDEAIHATRVLRHKVGDTIAITDGLGHLYACRIRDISNKNCPIEIISKKTFAKPDHHIHVALSPTKSADRTEWFVEKATELGIQKISFILTHHSERKKINVDRIRKTCISAMKQSGQVWMPEFSDLIPFKSILTEQEEEKYIAHVNSDAKHLSQAASKNKRYIILIGPEGDFTNEEVDLAHGAGFLSVSLGRNALRTETAGVVACHILNLIQNL